VVGLAKASSTLISDPFAEKCIDVRLRKRVTGALKIFWATQHYLQSVFSPRVARREGSCLCEIPPFCRDEFASCTTSNSVAFGCHPSRHEPLDTFDTSHPSRTAVPRSEQIWPHARAAALLLTGITEHGPKLPTIVAKLR
jgi:hypothetical protein